MQVNNFVHLWGSPDVTEYLPLQGETPGHARYRNLRHQHRGSSNVGDEVFIGASLDNAYSTL